MMKVDGSEAIRTLVIAPHMDDEVLGAGGLIRKRVACGNPVFVLTCFGRKYPPMPGGNDEIIARQKTHFEEARKVLGYEQVDHLGVPEGEPGQCGYYALLEPIEHYLKVWHPTEVVIPGRSDLNQDHRHLNDVCRIALRAGNRVHDAQQGPIRQVLEMVAHDVREMPAEINYAVPLTDAMAVTVLKAWKCYEDEQREHPHVRSVQNLISRYRFFGAQFGFDLAEPFRLVFRID